MILEGGTVLTGDARLPRSRALAIAVFYIRKADDEMAHVFNLGLGMLAVVAPGTIEATLDTVRAAGQEAWIVGEVSEGRGRVSITRK